MAFRLGREAVDAGGEDGLHRGRHVNAGDSLGQLVRARRADEHARLHQRLDALLQEKGVALGPLDQPRRERRQPGIIAQQLLEQRLGTVTRQRVEAQLGIEGLAGPAVLILRTVTDEEQQAHGRQAIDEAVEERLCLGVDPVQVLDDQHHRLDLALAQQEAFEGIQDALAALERIKGVPLGIVNRYVQKREEGWQGWAEGFIQAPAAGWRFALASAARRRDPRAGNRP